MSRDDDSEMVGKKIFFLYPNAIVHNRIISELVQQEYEVYLTRDKDALRRVLKKYPDSIVFVDINEGMDEKQWEAWITAFMEAPDTKGVYIGIVTTNDDEQIKHKYLKTIKVPCGYTVLKFELDKAVAHIFDILQAVKAKGRRKYLRATMEKNSNATINLPVMGTYVKGQIKDVSVVGVSCTLEDEPEIAKNTLIKDIQIKLQSSLLKVEGIVFGSRISGKEKEKVYVFLFTQRIDPEVRVKIRKYIQQFLQAKMEAELK